VTGSVANIVHLGGNPDFKFIEQDVTEFSLSGCAGPLRLAFLPPRPARLIYLEIPIKNPQSRLIGHAIKPSDWPRTRAPGFLLASTSEIYGDPLVHPPARGLLGQCQHHWSRAVVYDEAKRFR